jgi:RNA polymerase sigma factor (sigma-70 family)
MRADTNLTPSTVLEIMDGLTRQRLYHYEREGVAILRRPSVINHRILERRQDNRWRHARRLVGVMPSQERTDYEEKLGFLTNRLIRDDSNALKDILALLGGKVERALRSRYYTVLTEADIEDVLSISLFRLWQHRQKFNRRVSRLDTWFYSLANHAAIDLLRKKRRWEPVEKWSLDSSVGAQADPTGGGPPSEAIESLRRDLIKALERLSETDRRILLSQDSATDLGKELGMPANRVRVKRFRGLQKLRTILGNMGHEPKLATRR